MLANVTIFYFLPANVSAAFLVKMLENIYLCYIHSCMKYIHMVPMQYTTLKYLWNNIIILTRYNGCQDTLAEFS